MIMTCSQRYPFLKPCLIKYDLDINVNNFENWFFSIMVYKIDLRISTAEKTYGTDQIYLFYA